MKKKMEEKTLGLVLLEAMASGLPIIAAESGPTMEQVRHMRNGMVFQNGDLQSMLNAVKLLDNKQLFQTLKRNACQKAEKFSWENASQQLLDYYDQLLEGMVVRKTGKP